MKSKLIMILGTFILPIVALGSISSGTNNNEKESKVVKNNFVLTENIRNLKGDTGDVCKLDDDSQYFTSLDDAFAVESSASVVLLESVSLSNNFNTGTNPLTPNRLVLNGYDLSFSTQASHFFIEKDFTISGPGSITGYTRDDTTGLINVATGTTAKLDSAISVIDTGGPSSNKCYGTIWNHGNLKVANASVSGRPANIFTDGPKVEVYQENSEIATTLKSTGYDCIIVKSSSSEIYIYDAPTFSPKGGVDNLEVAVKFPGFDNNLSLQDPTKTRSYNGTNKVRVKMTTDCTTTRTTVFDKMPLELANKLEFVFNSNTNISFTYNADTQYFDLYYKPIKLTYIYYNCTYTSGGPEYLDLSASYSSVIINPDSGCKDLMSNSTQVIVYSNGKQLRHINSWVVLTDNKNRLNLYPQYITDDCTIIICPSKDDTKTLAEAYVADYLHMEDYNDSLGYCNDTEHHYYATAKEAFNLLRVDVRLALIAYMRSDLSSSAIHAAMMRLNEWAEFNGETIDVVNLGFTTLSKASRPIFENTSDPSLLILGCVCGVSLIGIFLLSRSKKKHA